MTELEHAYAERRLALLAAEIIAMRRRGRHEAADRATRQRDAYAREAYRAATSEAARG